MRRTRNVVRRVGWATAIASLACQGSAPPIRIGVVASQAGVAGAELAMWEINASGGIHGRPLTLRVMRDGGSTMARPALASAESLAQDPEVIAVVGHSNSSASMSAAQIYNAARIVQIAPTSSAPGLAQAGRYTFRLVASDIHQARFLADLVIAEGSRSRTAVAYVNDEYGRGLYEELRRRLGSSGSIVYEAPYIEEDSLGNISALARGIADAHPSVLVWLGRPTQLRQLLPVLRRQLPQLRILGSDGLDTSETERNDDGTLTGVRYACFVDVNGDRAPLRSLRERLFAKTGQGLTPETALTYDATMLLAAAARAVGPRRDAIRAYLVSLGVTRPPYVGASRDIAFDSTGAPGASYCLAEITDRGARVIPSPGR